MRKIAPFIPIIGVLLVVYYVLKNEETGINESAEIFIGSALLQVISFISLYEIFIK